MTATTFEDLQDDGFGALSGGSEEVLAGAFALDTGKALTETDLFPEGTYPLHTSPGQYILLAHKVANGNIRVEARVYKSAEALFELELERDRARNELVPKDQKCKYNCPPWAMALLLFEHDTAPGHDNFEKKLYENFPRYWLDDARAPRKLIL